MVILYLTCATDKEADAITRALLEQKLIACARKWPVNSTYWWDGKINQDGEVLLMMEGLEEKFEEIDKAVAIHHSYEQYVLTMVEVDKTTHGVHQWLNETLDSTA